MNPDSQFIGLNFIVLAGVALVIFAYLVMLIRKRWKKGFLHDAESARKEKK